MNNINDDALGHYAHEARTPHEATVRVDTIGGTVDSVSVLEARP